MRSWKIILSSGFREASQSGKDKNIPELAQCNTTEAIALEQSFSGQEKGQVGVWKMGKGC